MQKNYVRLIECKVDKMSNLDGICSVLNEHSIHNVKKVVFESSDFTIEEILVEYSDFATANKVMIEHLLSIITKTPT